MTALERLAETLRDEPGLLADAVDPASAPGASTATADAAAGPRTSGHDAEYAFLAEAIREGYELHYGSPRVVVTDDDDLALLAGDRLYALGLARLAELGDLEGVAVLAGIISASARAHAEGLAENAATAWAHGLAALSGRSTA
jgi:hypothetical protein